MVKTASSSSSSPVTITVSSGGKGSGSRSMGLTSPVSLASVSNNPNSPQWHSFQGGRRVSSGGRYCSVSKDETLEEMNSELVTSTVHIPPTPDQQSISGSQSLNEGAKNVMRPERSFILGTIFAVGVARTMYSLFPQWSKLRGGVFFSFCVLFHLYPFAKGLMGRKGKVPPIVFIWSGLLSLIVSLLWCT